MPFWSIKVINGVTVSVTKTTSNSRLGSRSVWSYNDLSRADCCPYCLLPTAIAAAVVVAVAVV